MSTMRLIDLIPTLMPDLVGCEEPLAERAFRDAAIRLCEDAFVWVRQSGPDTVEAPQDDPGAGYPPNQYELLLDVPTKARVVEVISVTVAGRPLVPMHLSDLDSFRGNWRQSGPVWAYTHPQDNVVYLAGAAGPPVTDVYTRIALAPCDDITELPMDVFAPWRRALTCGAKAELFRVPGTEWTNQSLADKHDAMFKREINRAKLLYAQGTVNAARYIHPLPVI